MSMEILHSIKIFSYLILLLILHFSSPLLSSAADYALPGHYFINCGSASTSLLYDRNYTGDDRNYTGEERNTVNFTLSSGGSRLQDVSNSSRPETIYQTARMFTKASSYKLDISENGIYVVRFHFFPFSSLSNARFNIVTSSGFSLLSSFSIQNRSYPLVQEFLITIPPGKFGIHFVPYDKNSFAFVNAMEVFLAPPDFVHDTPPPRRITREGFQGNYTNVLSVPFRVVHRINVGGENVTPDNDTLLRTWIPDDDDLLSRNTGRISTPYNSKLEYHPGGADSYDAPDSVYKTAKELYIVDNRTSNLNMSWSFQVRRRASHLVRVHFCDIVSRGQNPFVYFNLYVYSKFGDVIAPYFNYTNRQLAAPFYIDYVVESDDSGFMNISVGTRNGSDPRIAFLNGVEIMELVSDRGMVPDEGNSRRKLLFIIAGSVAGAVVLVSIVLAVLIVCLRKKKGKPVEAFDWPVVPPGSSYSGTTNKTSVASPLIDLNLGLKIPFNEILRATKNFDPQFMIGEGGFGKVYKGILKNGTKVAVKRSQPGHGQGLFEFQTEILILSKIRHHHLVSLIGYCDERDEMILVYEFMEKGTLKDHLYMSKGESKEGSTSRSELSWVQRLGISIGAAKGIVYLHTGSDRAIIHRDIKSTNILLDEHYVAKVADFGLSRSGLAEQSYVSTEVKGSFGYLDPEYFRCLQLTQKSDVYSFGVVLLEVLCARPVINHDLPKDQVNLADWGLSWQRKGELEKIVDPILVGKINPDSLRKFGEIVEKCLQENGSDRPKMVNVLWDLEYSLQLQNSGVRREMHEDSTTTDVLPMQVFQRLPSLSVPFGEDELPHEMYSINSDASQVNDSQVFSQLNVGEAR